MAERSGLRTTASVFFLLAVLTVLFSGYVALVYGGVIDAGAGWVTNVEFGAWIATFFVILAVLLVILLFLFAAAPRPAREAEVPPSEEREPPTEAAPEVEVTCEHCGKPYLIVDTGERPLYHACPHCGHSDVLEEDGAPIVEAEEEEELVPGTIRETATGEKELILRCSNCAHVFPTPYTEERPLYAYCPNCGRKGVLEEAAPDTLEAEAEEPAAEAVDEEADHDVVEGEDADEGDWSDEQPPRS